MKIAGITRVRNESGIIQNTLDHVAKFVDVIYVYDDASEDLTPNICEAHPAVDLVVQGDWWDPTPKGRAEAEGLPRHKLYEYAVKQGADWVYCFDADEYLVPVDIDFKADTYYFRLFDYYITPEDIDATYLEREWMGPEYRDIPMLFNTKFNLRFTQRVPRGYGRYMEFGGWVKHYGKAYSVEQWEEDCRYYAEVRWKDRRPVLRQRWLDRMGKAVHTKSDFDRPLITWEDRKNEDIIVAI
jgi:hypothetical protein